MKLLRLDHAPQPTRQRHSIARVIFAAVLLLAAATVSTFVSHPPTAHAGSLSNPSWWNGYTCDVGRGGGATGAVAGTWNGLQACYPTYSSGGWKPYDNQPDFSTGDPIADGNQVPAGAWECVELSERYLDLEYNLPGLTADGTSLVDNYYAYFHSSRPDLSEGVANTDGNGFVSLSPNVYPQVGDVVSIEWLNGGPHTAIVTGVSIDGNGNGTINLFQQNAYNGPGYSVPWVNGHLNVSNWYLLDAFNNNLYVFKWLHDSPQATTQKWVGQVANGELETFQVDSTGHVSYSYQEGKGSANWSGWSTLSSGSGEPFVGTPAVGTNSDGRLFVFARGASGKIWLATETTSGDPAHWSAWSNFTNPSGVSMVSDPAVAAGQDGRLYLFVIDNNGVVRLQNQTSPNGPWLSTGYSQFSNPSGTTMVGDPAVAAGADGRLYLFVDDNSGVVRLQNQTTPNGGWLSGGFSQFSNPSGVTMAGNPVVAPDNTGRLYLFVRDSNGVIREQNQTTANGSWLSGYSQFSNPNGITMVSDPTSVRGADGRLYLFVVDNNGVIRLQNQTTAGGAWLSGGYSQFSNPSGVSMVTNPSPTAGVDSTGMVQIFGLGSAGSSVQMYRAYQTTAGGSWHVLVSIGGSF